MSFITYMNVFITFYNIDSDRNLFISSGFFFVRHLFEGIDLFFSQTATQEDIKTSICDINEKIDRIYCTINYSFEAKLIQDIVDDRWVVGGPEAIEIIREGTSVLLSKGTVIGESFEEYHGLSPSTTFTYYFKDLVAEINPRVVSYPCSIGSGCYWNKCSFCSFHKYSDSRGYYVKSNVTEIINNLLPLAVPSQVHTCISSCSPQVLEQILAATVKDGIILSEFIRADQSILDLIHNSRQMSFKNHLALLGIETLSQALSDRLNKGASVANYIRLVESILSRGGYVALYVMTWLPFITEESAQESMRNLKKIEKIAKKYPRERFSIINSGEVLWPTETIAKKMGSGLPTYKSFKHLYGVKIGSGSKIEEYNRKINQSLLNSSIPLKGDPITLTYGS